MTDREKLAGVLCDTGMGKTEAYFVADSLIANGVTFQQWIPVTERLPEEKGSYLTARRRDVFVEQWNGVLFSERCHHAQPTHWMSLPEPPKGE